MKAALAAVRQARENVEGAKAAFTHAEEEHQRIQRFHEQGTASQQQLDQARVEFEKAQAEYRGAKQGVAQAQGELEAARSRLARRMSDPGSLPDRMSIRAPADGRILRVH